MSLDVEVVNRGVITGGRSLRGELSQYVTKAPNDIRVMTAKLPLVGDGAQVKVHGPFRMDGLNSPYVIKTPRHNDEQTLSGLTTSVLINNIEDGLTETEAFIVTDDKGGVGFCETYHGVTLNKVPKEKRNDLAEQMPLALASKLTEYHQKGAVIFDITPVQMTVDNVDTTNPKWNVIDKSMGMVWLITNDQVNGALQIIERSGRNKQLIMNIQNGGKGYLVDKALRNYEKLMGEKIDFNELGKDKESYNMMVDLLIETIAPLQKLNVFGQDFESDSGLSVAKKQLMASYGQDGVMEGVLDIFRSLTGQTTSDDMVRINATRNNRNIGKYMALIGDGIKILKEYKQFKNGGLPAMADFMTDEIARMLGFDDQKCEKITVEDKQGKKVSLTPPRMVAPNRENPLEDYRKILSTMRDQLANPMDSPNQPVVTLEHNLALFIKEYWRMCALDHRTAFDVIAVGTSKSLPNSQFAKEFVDQREVINAGIAELENMAETGMFKPEEFYRIEKIILESYRHCTPGANEKK